MAVQSVAVITISLGGTLLVLFACVGWRYFRHGGRERRPDAGSNVLSYEEF